MKVKKSIRNTIVLSITLILALILWYSFSNPASSLEERKVSQAGIYAVSGRTLWDYGYDPDNFNRADPQYGDFDYNAIFKGDALNKVIEALKYPGKSYYILPKNQEDYSGLYVINIKINDNEGFMFITKDLHEESEGKFIGYKYKGKENVKRQWIEYNNPRLGQVLMELRSR